MNRLRGIFVGVMMAFFGVVCASSSPALVWEDVTVPVPAITQTMVMEGETEVVVSDGYIYIWSERAVTVKIFSILGQLISQETVKPGLHRIKLNSRGIFILRAGTTTRRITL